MRIEIFVDLDIETPSTNALSVVYNSHSEKRTLQNRYKKIPTKAGQITLKMTK